jgi:hypothetical protein
MPKIAGSLAIDVAAMSTQPVLNVVARQSHGTTWVG